MQRLNTGPVRRAIRHARTSANLTDVSEQPDEELRCEERESAAEHDAGDLAFRAALPEHAEHRSTDDDGPRARASTPTRPVNDAFEIARGASQETGRMPVWAGEGREHHRTHASNHSDYVVAGHREPPALVSSELRIDLTVRAYACQQQKPAPGRRTCSSDLAACLGVRRTMTLRRIMRQTGLPPEVLLDLALRCSISQAENSPIANKTAGCRLGRCPLAKC